MAEINGIFIDDLIAKHIPKWVHDVKKRDFDKVLLFDGREGTGKSVLAMQMAKALDPEFNIDKIAFNSQQFIDLVKSDKRKKGDFILLDEAFNAASARASLSQINKAMMTVATEMRQLNLFIGIVLPSFFDLDRYFAIWRCETLFHVYKNRKGLRGQYILFPFNKKKLLYLKGKKTYNYGAIKSPYPACRFSKAYVIDEELYRKRKAEAFRERPKSVDRFDKLARERLATILRTIKERDGLTWEEVGKLAKMTKKATQNFVLRGELGTPDGALGYPNPNSPINNNLLHSSKEEDGEEEEDGY